MPYINPDNCIDCDQCRSECPVEAIFPEWEVPAEWHVFIPLNAEMSEKCPQITERKEPLAGR
jgi:ferredoxin